VSLFMLVSWVRCASSKRIRSSQAVESAESATRLIGCGKFADV
jgi:hypothetical protein